MSPLVLVILAAVFVLGVAALAMQRADRRRESRQQRLRAITALGPMEPEPVLSLRRPLTRAGIRDFFLLSALWSRLDAAFAAAGNWVGLPHLAAAGLAAAGLTVLFTEKVMGFDPALVILLGAAAAAGVPVVLLR